MVSTLEAGDEAYFPIPMKESFFEDDAQCILGLEPESFLTRIWLTAIV